MPAVYPFIAIFIATFSFNSIGIARAEIESLPVINGGGDIQLNFLGTVDGKSYFTDNELKNWLEASAYCKLTGMHLATITSEAQWEVLAAAYDPVYFDSNYWISLRDSHQPRQFSWDLLETEPSTTIGLIWDAANNNVGDEYFTCVSINSQPNLAALNVDRCGTARRVLCET